ncbi:MAG TPA: Ku protein [bacterium]|nr:Ku protein [bacterium]
MAAIWDGSISFGLVEIPVALRSAEKSNETSATQLDKRDLSPIGYRRYNKTTGKEVEWKDIVSGFEADDGQYVVLTEEELRSANPKATKTIEIVEFVDGADIETVFYDKPYYLEPKKKGSKAYALLRETLQRTGKVGIAKVVIRTREHLAALVVRDQVLVLNLLRFAHELRDADDLVVPEEGARGVKVSSAEIKMAEQLVEGMTAKWNPDEFKDEYRDELRELVQRKARTGKVAVVKKTKETDTGKVVDLMSMLKKSLEEKAKTSKRPRAQQRRRARRKTG